MSRRGCPRSLLAVDGSIGQHERSRQDPAFPRFSESLRGLGEGLEWLFNSGHINEGDKLHAFVHFVHGHSVHGKFHGGICNPYPNVANSDKRRTLLVVCWMSRSTT